jgi:hypothetical protein
LKAAYASRRSVVDLCLDLRPGDETRIGSGTAGAYRCGHPSQPLQITPIWVTQIMGIDGPAPNRVFERHRIGKTCPALQLCLSASDLGDVPQAGSLCLNFSPDWARSAGLAMRRGAMTDTPAAAGSGHAPGGTEPGLIRRHDLVAALNRAAQKRVTLISAPAGTGKTSLLRAWADHPGQDCRIAFMTVRLASTIRSSSGSPCWAQSGPRQASAKAVRSCRR